MPEAFPFRSGVRLQTFEQTVERMGRVRQIAYTQASADAPGCRGCKAQVCARRLCRPEWKVRRHFVQDHPASSRWRIGPAIQDQERARRLRARRGRAVAHSGSTVSLHTGLFRDGCLCVLFFCGETFPARVKLRLEISCRYWFATTMSTRRFGC